MHNQLPLIGYLAFPWTTLCVEFAKINHVFFLFFISFFIQAKTAKRDHNVDAWNTTNSVSCTTSNGIQFVLLSLSRHYTYTEQTLAQSCLYICDVEKCFNNLKKETYPIFLAPLENPCVCLLMRYCIFLLSRRVREQNVVKTKKNDVNRLGLLSLKMYKQNLNVNVFI